MKQKNDLVQKSLKSAIQENFIEWSLHPEDGNFLEAISVAGVRVPKVKFLKDLLGIQLN